MKKKSNKKIIIENKILSNTEYFTSLEKWQFHQINFFLNNISEEYKKFVEETTNHTWKDYTQFISNPLLLDQNTRWITISLNSFYYHCNDCTTNLSVEVGAYFSPHKEILISNLDVKRNERSEEWKDVFCLIGPYHDYLEINEILKELREYTKSPFNKLLEKIDQLGKSGKVLIWWCVVPYLYELYFFDKMFLPSSNHPNNTS